jgi:hypothetical protein
MTDQGQITWRKSRRSADGNCVEVAVGDASIHVRDSKDPSGPILTFDLAVFRGFIEQLKQG